MPVPLRGGLPVAKILLPLAVATPIPEVPAAPVAGTSGADNAQAKFANRYTAADLGAPVNEWSRVRSTWVYAIQYDPYPEGPYGDLQIETTDGWIGLWANTARQDYLDLWHAPRKGVWLSRWPRKSQYKTMRGQQYFGKALKARVQANA